jgi:phosphatidate cytidylyltransferase
MIKKINGLKTRLITALIFGLLFWGVFLFLPPRVTSLGLLTILIVILLFEWPSFLSHNNKFLWILTPLYPVLPFMLLIMMNENPITRPLLYYLFGMVFIHDTASYVIGSLIGTTKIMPSISPGKSWQGFFGGFLATCCALQLSLWEFKLSRQWFAILTISFAVCALSLFGDLFESWLKRRANIKDSGSLLPGHGGFLDRFDGVLSAAFFFYIYRYHLVPLLLGSVI